jgi:acyl-CoA thioesterase
MSETLPVSKDDMAQTVASEMYVLDNAARALGITISEPRSGGARARMVVRKDMLNIHGTCQGGIIFSFADTAFAYACNSGNRATVGMNCTISYLNPCHEGDVLNAVAIERMRERRNGVYDVTVTGPDDRIIAIFQGNSREIRGETVPGLTHRMAECKNTG